MNARWPKDFPNAVWHITNRVNWQAWHLAPDLAYATFIQVLTACLAKYGVDLVAFVVMSNHFHAVLRSPEFELFRRWTSRRTKCRHYVPWPPHSQKSEVISQFVKELKRRTSAAMHEHLGIGGHFWENPHDRVLVETPDQLLFAVAYDHRNPVRVGMTARPQEYERSSARWWADGTASDVPLCARPDLPFGISKEAFRTQLVTFQDSKAVSDIMEACARRDRGPWTADTWVEIRAKLEEAGLTDCGANIRSRLT